MTNIKIDLSECSSALQIVVGVTRNNDIDANTRRKLFSIAQVYGVIPLLSELVKHYNITILHPELISSLHLNDARKNQITSVDFIAGLVDRLQSVDIGEFSLKTILKKSKVEAKEDDKKKQKSLASRLFNIIFGSKE